MKNDETSNTTSDEETSSRRSVRFNEETSGDSGLGINDSTATDEEGNKKSDNKLTDYVTHMSLKRHTSLFHNALRRKNFIHSFSDRFILNLNNFSYYYSKLCCSSIVPNKNGSTCFNT